MFVLRGSCCVRAGRRRCNRACNRETRDKARGEGGAQRWPEEGLGQGTSEAVVAFLARPEAFVESDWASKGTPADPRNHPGRNGTHKEGNRLHSALRFIGYNSLSKSRDRQHFLRKPLGSVARRELQGLRRVAHLPEPWATTQYVTALLASGPPADRGGRGWCRGCGNPSNESRRKDGGERSFMYQSDDLPPQMAKGCAMSYPATGIRRPPALRHYAATSWLRGGAGLDEVRRLLGHESLTTTLRNSSLVGGDLQRAHRKAGAIERLRLE